MQFHTKNDLRELLQFIAVREKRDGDKKKLWYLVPDHSSLDCWHVQPRESRRQQRRRNEKQSRGNMVVDETLLVDGALAEAKWFDMLKWSKEV